MEGDGNFCGKEEWFHNGVPAGTPPVVIVGGIPACCADNLVGGTIGLRLGVAQEIPCQPMINWALAEMLFPDGTWRKMDNRFPGIPNSWHLGQELFTYDFVVQGFLTNSRPNCAQFRLWQVFRDVSLSADMVNMGPDPDHAGAFIWYSKQPYFSPGPDVRRSIRFAGAPVTGSLGIRVGLLRTPPYGGILGLETGLESELAAELPAAVGAELGLESELAAELPAAVGAELGLESALAGLVVGAVGAKLGLESELAAELPAAVGAELGLESVAIATYVGEVGIKLGLASVPFGGVIKPCCPGVAIPLVLSATGSNGAPYTATYNAASNAWLGTDPGTGRIWQLKCNAITGGNQWQNTIVQAQCNFTYSVQSLQCSPFALSCRTVASGPNCAIVGTYNFTFSA